MCDRVVSEDHFLIVYCPDKYKTQRMYDQAVDDSLAALNLIPKWFGTSKMIKKLLEIYSTLMIMSYFLLVMKWIFLM